MDLFEYQARELFAKHGVPVLAGEVVDTPEEARAAAERTRRPRRRQGAGQDRRPRQGRRREARRRPPTRPRARADDDPRHGHQGPHRPQGDARRGRADIAEEYYFSFLLDRANRTFLAMATVEGGMEIEEVADEQPRGAGQDRRSTPSRASTRRRPARSSTPAKFPAEVADQVADVLREAVGGLRRRGRHARRGQPAGEDRATARSSPSTARSPSTRTPTSATPTTRRSRTRPRPTRSRPRPRRRTSTTSSSTARSASSATAPAWSCRTLDVVAYAGEEHGGVKPANFLDIGGGASRRGHGRTAWRSSSPTRTSSRSSSTSSAASPPATRSPTASCRRSSCSRQGRGRHQAAGRPPRRQQRRARVARILDDADHPLVERVDTMDGAADRAAELAAAKSEDEARHHGYLPHRGQQGHRPGHDRLRGHEAHPAHARRRHQHRRRRQPAQGRHDGRLRRHRASRSSAPSPRRWRRPAPTSPSSSCRRRSPRPPSSRRSTPGSPLAVVITEGIPVHDTAAFWAYAQAQGHRPGSSARTAPA